MIISALLAKSTLLFKCDFHYICDVINFDSFVTPPDKTTSMLRIGSLQPVICILVVQCTEDKEHNAQYELITSLPEQNAVIRNIGHVTFNGEKLRWGSRKTVRGKFWFKHILFHFM